MNKDIILAVLRHVATASGSLVTANGVLTAEDWQTASGAIIALVGLGLSIYDKRKRK